MLLQPPPCAPSQGFPRPLAAPGAMHGSQKDTTFANIFVGGLPYHITDASLRKYFEGFSYILEAVVITDRQTGKSRGYGFLTTAHRAAAERACKDPNPIIDCRKANAQCPPATYDQYPYAASPATAASFVGYSYPAAVPQALSATAPTTFVQYQAPQLLPDRMQ
ncbi:hypothetical protein H8959_020112 [Pygathrix nigripes]